MLREPFGQPLAPGVGSHDVRTIVEPLPLAHVVRATWVDRFMTDSPAPPSSAIGRQPLTRNVRTVALSCTCGAGESLVHSAADACSADATNGMTIKAHPAIEIAMRRRVG